MEVRLWCDVAHIGYDYNAVNRHPAAAPAVLAYYAVIIYLKFYGLTIRSLNIVFREAETVLIAFKW